MSIISSPCNFLSRSQSNFLRSNTLMSNRQSYLYSLVILVQILSPIPTFFFLYPKPFYFRAFVVDKTCVLWQPKRSLCQSQRMCLLQLNHPRLLVKSYDGISWPDRVLCKRVIFTDRYTTTPEQSFIPTFYPLFS